MIVSSMLSSEHVPVGVQEEMFVFAQLEKITVVATFGVTAKFSVPTKKQTHFLIN